MSDFNKVILVGRIGNDLELKTSAQGKPYLKLSIATKAYRKGGEGSDIADATHWHRVMAFGAQAQTCAAYMSKGSTVLIDGFLEERKWTDKDGRKTSNSTVIANRVSFMGGRMHADVTQETAVEPAAVSA